MCTVAAACGADGFLWEPWHPVAQTIEIRLSRLPESFHGFRIAQLSDIHFGPYMGVDRLQRALRLAQSFQPDLVAFTGDFVSSPIGRSNGPAGARFAEPCADVIARWKGVPLCAILGNHDHWNGADFVAAALRERGIRLLRNESFPIERDHERLWITGVDDVFERKADLPRALSSVAVGETTLLLAHEPDYADLVAKFSVDLQLSGHSHGGQVRVPGVGPIILPKLAQKYHTGLYRVHDLQVYTSRGLGVITPPVRFNCPPEVTLITLLRGRPAACNNCLPK
jgi:predicted MPP superfamily phosphohydrolase